MFEIQRISPESLTCYRATGLRGLWRGKKHEDRHTQVALVLWESLAASHAFFTTSDYAEFHRVIQPAMNGRRIEWLNHVLIGTTGLDDKAHLSRILASPAIEVALTKVVDGGVSGYYSQFRKIVVPILDEDTGCDGHFISPLIENPQDQLLLINWKSVDVSWQSESDKHQSIGTNVCSRPIMKILRRNRHSRRVLMDLGTTTPYSLFPGILRSLGWFVVVCS